MQQLQGGPAEVAADAVVDEGHPTEPVAHLVGPVRLRVVDDHRGAELGEGRRPLRAAGRGDHLRTHLQRRLHEQPAEPTRRRRHEHRVVGSGRLDLEHPERGPTGAQHGSRVGEADAVGHGDQVGDVGDRLLGVAPGHHPEMGHHPAADPAGVDTFARLVDHTRDLPTGSRGQLRRRERAGLAPADRGVDEVDAADPDGDTHLTVTRTQVRQVVETRLVAGPNSWRRMAFMSAFDKLKLT